MKIAVNTRFLLKGQLEGIGWYTYHTFSRITRLHPDHTFYFLFDRKYSPEYIFSGNVIPRVVYPPARHPVLFYIWFEWSIPAVLKQIQPDVFVSTDNFLSLHLNVPQVLVVHDLAFEHFPEHLPFSQRLYYRHFMPKYVHKASRIVTVSEATKQDVIRQYGVPASHIDVSYNGVHEVFRPLDAGVIQTVRQRFAGGNPYFLFAGALHPRKNVANLLRAFDRFKSITGSSIKLVITGRKAWKFRDIMYTYEKMQFRNDVVFTGHLPVEELALLTGSAYALTYVSLFEGFGIPVVEAMACGVPVITSNVSSMPEVAGDSALLVNPADVGEIADAMVQIVSNQALYLRLKEKSLNRAKQFSWDNTADVLWRAILRACEAG